MSKSPYELRTELLTMAMQILMQQREAAANLSAQERYQSGKDADPRVWGVTEEITTESVIEEARKLNAFIQEKGDRR